MIKTQTDNGLVRVLYGREPGDEPLPARRDSFGFALALAALSSLFALLAVCSGCSSAAERHDHLIRAGKVLVRHWGEADWISRRDTWLAAAEIECPDAPEGAK